MLTHLHIRHFAIIDDTALELDAGMTALTGETGAGKSILLDALGQVLGDRATPLSVQQGAVRAEIAASFRLDALPEVQAWLARHELDTTDEEDCVLRRTLGANGKSRATVNGTPVSLRMLGELGGRLVGIHGQNAHQLLGVPAEQRRALDDWSASRPRASHALVEQVRDAHAALAEAERRHREAMDESGARLQRADLLRFQLQEFDELDIGALPVEEIESEHRWLANVERLRALGSEALAALEEGAGEALGRALRPLGELAAIDERLREAHDLIESAAIQTSEATSALRAEVSALENDDARLAWLDGKLGELHALAKKHRCAAAELPAVEQRLRDELDELNDPAAGGEALARARDVCLERYRDRAEALGRRRRRDAKKLSATVTDALQTLAMEGGRFEIRIDSDPQVRSPHGIDTVTFLVSPNPGVAPGPLARIASGGELSRIGLAIRLATLESRQLPTLIFDEVDAGIGGAVAETVGRLLRRLGERAQVLCVTHLPQVAAQAHHHLRVSKRVAEGRTRTDLTALDAEATRDEIARMLGGAKLTRRSRQHAQEMLDEAAGGAARGEDLVADTRGP